MPHYHLGSFPTSRMRRHRSSEAIRSLVAECSLTAQDFIWPIFVQDDCDTDVQSIPTMPCVQRYKLSQLDHVLQEALDKKIQAIALFPKTPNVIKDVVGSEAINPHNLIARALDYCYQFLKEKRDHLLLIADVALDPYTSHGHDGVFRNGVIENDETLEQLGKQALMLANKGVDVLAPSDMMDGRIGYIRQLLDKAGFQHVMLMSYSVKYASSIYAPFRGAIGSGSQLVSHKKSYQMDFRNHQEAMVEIAKDIQEGADSCIIKPSMMYMDIIYHAKQEFSVPIIAYQVSGEYSMIMNAGEQGLLNSHDIMMENLYGLKRSGADAIITYYAPQAVAYLNNITTKE